MKKLLFCLWAGFIVSACTTHVPSRSSLEPSPMREQAPITQSLFSDKNSTISEEDIRKILFGSYKLPATVRIALVKVDASSDRNYFWNDENYLKAQQAYIHLLEEQLQKSNKVIKTSSIPELLLPQPYTFTGIREAAVRMQADMVLVFSVTNDVYANYKLFSKTDIKAFATTQAFLLDVRTGLVPFTTIVTKENLSQKKEGELDIQEARKRTQKDAVLLTLQEIGLQLNTFLSAN